MAHGDAIAAHRHADGQLVYSASGVLAVTTERGTWIAPSNRAVWTPAGFEHFHRAYGATDIRTLLLPAPLNDVLPRHPAVLGVSALLREALLVLTGGRRLGPAARDRLRAVAVDELVEAHEQPLHLPEPHDDRLRALTDLLRADPADPATLAELGRTVGASERTLSRLFRDELSMSFHQWRTQLRVHHALGLLAEGHSVTSTATACGWANPSSFIDSFTAIVGQTPGRHQRDRATA